MTNANQPARWKEPLKALGSHPLTGAVLVLALLLLANRVGIFTAPTSANGHVPAAPTNALDFAPGGCWHFGCLLLASVAILAVLRSLPLGRWRGLAGLALAAATLMGVLGEKAWEAPIFFLDVASALAPYSSWESAELPHAPLMSMNGVWVASGFSALVVTVALLFRRGAEPKAPSLAMFAWLVLSFAAILKGDPGASTSAFAALHPDFLLFPSALAFALLGIGSRMDGAPNGEHGPRVIIVCALIWSSLVLLFPLAGAGGVTIPLASVGDLISSGAATEVLTGVLLLYLAATTLVGWVWVVLLADGPEDRAKYAPVGLWALRNAHGGIVAFHVVAPLLADTPGFESTLASWLAAASLMLIVRWGPAVLMAEGRGEEDPTDNEGLSSGTWLPERVDTWLVVGGLFLYLLLKFHAAGPSNTDENIYFYMAQRLGEGEWPYRDYFFAHPPLHVILPGLLFALFGFSITAAKMVSVFAGALIAWVVWRMAREHLGRIAALVAFVAVIFATELLKSSSNMTGVNLTTMWLVLGAWQTLKGHGGRGGLFLALAACTGFYAMAAICALLVLAFCHSARLGLRQVAAFVLVAGAINAIGFAAGGDTYIDGVYRYHDLKKVQDGRMLPLFGAPADVEVAGEKLVIASNRRKVELVSARDGTTLIEFESPRGIVASLQLSANGETLALGTRNGHVALYNTRNGASLWRKEHLPRRRVSVNQVKFSPDSKRVYSAGNDGNIRAWDVATGQRLAVFRGHQARIDTLAISKDGRTLVSGSRDGVVGIWTPDPLVSLKRSLEPGWDPSTVHSSKRFIRLKGSVRSVAIDPTEKWLLASPVGEQPTLFNLTTGEALRRLGGKGTRATSVLFDPAIERVYLGLRSGDVQVYDVRDGRLLRTAKVHQTAVTRMKPSAGGTILSAAADGSVRLWNREQPGHSRLLPVRTPLIDSGSVHWPSFPATLVHNIGVMLDSKPFRRQVYYHPHLWMGFLLAPLLGWLVFLLRLVGGKPAYRFVDPRRLFAGPDGRAMVLWLIGLALLIEFAMFRELHSFYFTLVLPFLALSLGYVIGRPLQLLSRPSTTLFRRRLATALGVFMLLSLWPAWMVSASEVFPSERVQRGESKDYHWRLAPVAPQLSDISRDLFWKDRRITGEHERGVSWFLWTKKRLFRSLDPIASWIRDHSTPDDTIAGASSAAPIVALAAGRRIAAGEVDTNSKRFKAGLLDEETYWNRICADNVRFLISTSRSYFNRRKLQSLGVVQRFFREARVFYDPELRYGGRFPIRIYERIDKGGNCHWVK